MDRGWTDHILKQAGVLLLAFALLTGCAKARSDTLGYYEGFPKFALIAQDKAPVTREDFRGSVWIADCIFTRCTGLCPTMTSKMYRLQEHLKGVKLVSFTVDPDFDTPQVLKGYAEIAGAKPGRWWFLTGDKTVLNGVTTGLHFNGVDEPSSHSPYFVLVDRDGAVRGFYDSNDEARMMRLEKDARLLLSA